MRRMMWSTLGLAVVWFWGVGYSMVWQIRRASGNTHIGDVRPYDDESEIRL